MTETGQDVGMLLCRREHWISCCFSGYMAGADGYYGTSCDISAADRPVGIIRWGELECW